MRRWWVRGWLLVTLLAVFPPWKGLGLEQTEFDIDLSMPLPDQHYLAPPSRVWGKLLYRGEAGHEATHEDAVLEMVLDEAEGTRTQLWGGLLAGRDADFSGHLPPLGLGPHEVLLRLVVGGGQVAQVRIVPFRVCEPSLSISHPAEGQSIPHARAHSLRVDFKLGLGACLWDSAAVSPLSVTVDGRLLGPTLQGRSVDLSHVLRGSAGQHNVTLSLSGPMGRRLVSASRVFSVSTAPRGAVLLYHSHPLLVYKKKWIIKCLDSILAQSTKEFDILELDYAAQGFSVLDFYLNATGTVNLPFGVEHIFLTEPLPNHARAANLLAGLAFSRGYDHVFNVHLDDYYQTERFERQAEALARGINVVSGGFRYVRETGEGEDEIDWEVFDVSRLLHIDAGKDTSSGVCDEAQEEALVQRLREGSNPIGNSALALSRGMWLLEGGWACGGGEEGLFDDPPDEDLRLWQRCLVGGHISAHILPYTLAYARRHQHQVSSVSQRESDEWHRASGIR
eukprot:CAMPEP_0172001456 /NCGR_PEP_ID=MMETSP1041-20130122/2883_1 /TAXON_ID=464988 /ORGANISM="Hemiselmis andersenii, Strain CCMP439" /LENGTH=506 /DNA_ID=CAMNT_0012655105 /DNA_START=59 /DNA_END=1579 /DNA_ORIENTATION=+